MCDCVVTRHARERAMQRFQVSPLRAAAFVRRCWRDSVKLPRRYAQILLKIRAPRRKHGITYRVAGCVMMICRGKTVITVWELSTGELATVLLWACTGMWIAGNGKPDSEWNEVGF
ncbi:MAG: hypothetical protein ACI8RZ_006906 [Myxococcota bacterium]|jgi:hypothetical protein